MKKRQNGVAIVEFALVLPFLLLLSLFAIEFGRAIWHYNTLAKSVRDSVRYLSLQTPGDATAIQKARNLTVYGNLTGTGSPLVLGLTTSHVPAPTWTTAGTNPVIRVVTVRITGYTFNSMFPSAFGIPFGAIPFSDVSASMRSYL